MIDHIRRVRRRLKLQRPESESREHKRTTGIHRNPVIRGRVADHHQPIARRERLLRFVADPIFSEYRPVQRFNTTGDAELEPPTGSLPAWWEQDYLVYERVGARAPIDFR